MSNRLRGGALNDDFELVRQELLPGMSILVLCQKNKEYTFIDELAADPKRKMKAKAISEAALRLVQHGTAWAISTGRLKRLNYPKKTIAIYELKVMGKVHRIMTYVHDDRNQTPVLLFDFDGHKGSSGGGIRSSTLAKGQQYAEIACSLLREEL